MDALVSSSVGTVNPSPRWGLASHHRQDGVQSTPYEPLVIFVRMDGQGPARARRPGPAQTMPGCGLCVDEGMSPREWQINSPADQQEPRSQCAWLGNDLAGASGQRRSQVEWQPGRQTMGGSDGRVHFSQFMDA